MMAGGQRPAWTAASDNGFWRVRGDQNRPGDENVFCHKPSGTPPNRIWSALDIARHDEARILRPQILLVGAVRPIKSAVLAAGWTTATFPRIDGKQSRGALHSFRTQWAWAARTARSVADIGIEKAEGEIILEGVADRDHEIDRGGRQIPAG